MAGPTSFGYQVAGFGGGSVSEPLEISFLVIAGGSGGGGGFHGSGAGAGGYRSAWNGETSGGGASAQAALELDPGTDYTVQVGGGGSANGYGGNSIFANVSTVRGGKGVNNMQNGISGGSGGGGGGEGGNGGGAGTANEGRGGGGGSPDGGAYGAGGGGGGGNTGAGGEGKVGGNGGNGVASTIGGNSVNCLLSPHSAADKLPCVALGCRID